MVISGARKGARQFMGMKARIGQAQTPVYSQLYTVEVKFFFKKKNVHEEGM